MLLSFLSEKIQKSTQLNKVELNIKKLPVVLNGEVLPNVKLEDLFFSISHRNITFLIKDYGVLFEININNVFQEVEDHLSDFFQKSLEKKLKSSQKLLTPTGRFKTKTTDSEKRKYNKLLELQDKNNLLVVKDKLFSTNVLLDLFHYERNNGNNDLFNLIEGFGIFNAGEVFCYDSPIFQNYILKNEEELTGNYNYRYLNQSSEECSFEYEEDQQVEFKFEQYFFVLDNLEKTIQDLLFKQISCLIEEVKSKILKAL